MTPSVTVSVKRLQRGILETATAMLMLFGFAAMAHCNSGCGVFTNVHAPNAKEQNYTAAIVGCAATAKTKAEDHACRVGVNRQFGLCGSGSELPGDCE